MYKNGETPQVDRTYLYSKNYTDNNNDIWGFIDENNNWIIEPKYYGVEQFENGYAVVDSESGQGYKLIDSKDNSLGQFMHYFRVRNIVSLENDEIGTFNLKNGNEIGDDICFNYILIDSKENIDYSSLVPIKDLKTNLYGYYDTDGNKVIENKFAEANLFYKNNAIVDYNKKLCMIDRTGQIIQTVDLKLKDGEYISSINGDIIVVQSDLQVYLYKVGKGVILDDNNVNYVKFNSNGTILAYDSNSDGNITFYDRNGNKLSSMLKDCKNIYYDDKSNIYVLNYSNEDKNDTNIMPHDIIVVKNTKFEEIARAKDNMIAIIGNNRFCVSKDNVINTYNSEGELVNTIQTGLDIDSIYADNGVIFVKDSSGAFYGYTYLGEQLF